jgi:hypothetical protein
MEEQAVNNQVQQGSVSPVPVIKKPNHLLIAIIILVSLIFLGSVYILGQRLQKQVSQPIVPPPSISPSPTPNPTANWKTYRNTTYGFKLNYPFGWVFEEEKRQDQPSVLLYIGFRPEFTSDKPRPINYVNNASVILLAIQENSESLEEIIKIGSCHEYPESCTPYENVIDLVVADLPAKKVSPPDILPTDRVFLKQNSRLYLFGVTLDESFAKSHSLTVENKKKIFDQILTTFKFTDQKEQVACTQDAKLCPDGSYVSRQPPTCEFAKCP